MASIAYIADSKMLELHRLNGNQTINFWRLSNRINFSDFSAGDLVFFLSKDKQYQRGREKGVVGYGKLERIYLYSVRTMWDKFGNLNGYKDYAEFKNAIIRVSENHELPKKISSFYLTDVSFLQSPIYLSDYGIKVSSNVESFIYLEPEDTTIRLLEEAKKIPDIWFNLEKDSTNIEHLQLLYALHMTANKVGDVDLSESKKRKARKELQAYIKENPAYHFIQGSSTLIYRMEDNCIFIQIYHDKDVDSKALIGQAHLYRYFFAKYYPFDFNLYFTTCDQDEVLDELINSRS